MWDKMQVFYFGSDLLPRPKSLIPFSKVLGESPCTRCVCVCVGGWGVPFICIYIYVQREYNLYYKDNMWYKKLGYTIILIEGLGVNNNNC
jgi:hypothetical protein